ncbi:unnamed protein product [Closterium sp. Yama58-4]|nr:unnamed protein product [Closterium sp. Yama58-4]
MATHRFNDATSGPSNSRVASREVISPNPEHPTAFAPTAANARAGGSRIPLYAATTHSNGLLGLKLAAALPVPRTAHGLTQLRERGEKLHQQQRLSHNGDSVDAAAPSPMSPTRVVATSRVKFAEQATPLSAMSRSSSRQCATQRPLVQAGMAHAQAHSNSLRALEEPMAEMDILVREFPQSQQHVSAWGPTAAAAAHFSHGSVSGGEGARLSLHPAQPLAALKRATSGAVMQVRAVAESAAGCWSATFAGMTARAQVKLKLRLSPAASRLLSGAVAGGVSRTAVAPLETVRTHMMCADAGSVAASGSMARVFKWVVEKHGWAGLFRGNAINVLRVAPSKAIEMFTYETVKRALTPTPGLPPPLPFPLPLPISSIAGSSAGIASTVLMYPLELVKTRLTVSPHLYRGFLHAFHRIAREEGVGALYRGLAPSVMGVIPYAGANFFAYDALCTAYRKAAKVKQIDPLTTLLIGSTAGCFAAASTFPLEVTRKQLQMGATGGRMAYRGMLHCMQCIVREHGVKGLYRGVVPSCVKMMPAAGISFMCYEVLKRMLIEEERAA